MKIAYRNNPTLMKPSFSLNLRVFANLSSFLKDSPLIIIVLIAFYDSIESDNRAAMGISITIMALIYLKSFFLSFNEGKLKNTKSKIIIFQVIIFVLNLLHLSWVLSTDEKDLDIFFKGIKYTILQKLYMKTLKFSLFKILSLYYVSIFLVTSFGFNGFDLAFIIIGNIIYPVHILLTRKCKEKIKKRNLKIITRERANFRTLIPLDILLFNEKEINFIIDNEKKVIFVNNLFSDSLIMSQSFKTLKKPKMTFDSLKNYFKDYKFTLICKSKKMIDHQELEKTISVDEVSNYKNVYSFIQMIDLSLKEFTIHKYKSWIFEYSDKMTRKLLILHSFDNQYLFKSKEIKEERRKLERSQKTIISLISFIEHEIRTTLNSIFSAFQVIDVNSDENIKFIINSGLMSTKIFLNTTNDVLDYFRIRLQNFSLNNVEFDLEVLVKESIQVIKLPLDNRGISINFHNLLKKNFVFADPNRLNQILINLLCKLYSI